MYDQRIGVCWEPCKPDDVYNAIFNFNPINGGTLDLIHGDIKNKQMFQNFLERKNIILHGLFQNQYFTFFISATITERLLDIYTTYRVDLTIEGVLTDTMDKFCSSVYKLQIPYLESWINFTNCNIIKEYNKDFSQMKIKLPVKDSFFSTINEDLIIEIHTYPNLNVRIEESKLYRKAHLSLKFAKEKSFYEIKDMIYHLVDLLTLAINKPLYVESLKAKINDKEVNFLFRRRFGLKNADDSFFYGGCLFRFIDIIEKSSLTKLLQNWFENYENLKSVYRLFFLTYYSNDILESKFLRLAQALDYFTNIYISKNNISDKNISTYKFRRRKNKVINPLDCRIQKFYKKWLDKCLSNYLPFKKRIRVTAKNFSKIRQELKTFDNLINGIVEARNDLSHGFIVDSNSENFYLKSYDDFIKLFYGLKLILTILLLDKLGFDDDAILIFLKNECHYKAILENKYLYI